jgi:nucleoside-diphosphate-sugar epimerase
MILVTGGTGFIGGHLLAELVKDDTTIRALKRGKGTTLYTEKLFQYKHGSLANHLFSKIQWIEGDIMDIFSLEEAMEGVKEVYHCAAHVSLRDNHPDEIINAAEKGTENMVNAALAKGIEKFCHVSSVAALGKAINNKEVSEENFEDFSFNNAPYFIGKHLAESEVWRAHGEGLNVVVVNPSIVLGPWPDTHNGAMGFFSFVNKNSRFYTPGIMGFVDVKDVVGSMIQLIKQNKFNERYIINGENVSFKDLYTWIAQYLAKPLPKTQLNKTALGIFRLLYNLGNTKNKISRTMINHSTGVHIYNNKKVVEALNGYTFTPIKKTIEDTAKYFLCEVTKQN